MIYISHRGNINGKDIERENHPDYIDDAIRKGYDVEIDIWYKESKIWLGHDNPQYEISMRWLNDRKYKLWIHCKNLAAIELINWFKLDRGLNYFWHQDDSVTLTSRGYIWAYPGKQPIKDSIAVLPEIYGDDVSQCIGICSDIIEEYKNGKRSS
jgi:hypothetical protein